jgi:hypothetical protein
VDVKTSIGKMMIHCQRFYLESKLHFINIFTLSTTAAVALCVLLARGGKGKDLKAMGLDWN